MKSAYLFHFAAILVSTVQALTLLNDSQARQKANSISIESPGVISKEIFNIQTPNYPQAFNERTNIRWTISKSDIKVCSMTFIIKDLELDSTSCNDAYLLIGEHKFCKTILSGRIEVQLANNPMEVVQVRFFALKKTNLGNKFRIMGIQHSETCTGPIQLKPIKDCSVEYKADDGIFGQSKFLNNSLNYPETNCILTFKRSANHCGVKFNFLAFDFGSNCDLDYVVFDGKKYCGQQLLQETRTIPYPKDTFKDLAITVNIGSTDFHGEGFFASYIRVQNGCPVDCSEKFSNSSFTLQSPGRDMYLNNVDCEYTVLRESSQTKCLEVELKRISLNSSGDLCYDYLQLFNNRKICKISQLPSKIYKVAFPIRKNYLKVRFHTDHSGQSSGFEISIKQLSENCPEDTCQNIDSTAMMVSPQYPENYPKNVQCKYIITREMDKPMKMKMFKLEYNLAQGAMLTTPDGNIFKNIFQRHDTYELSLYNDIEIPFKSFSSSGPGFQIFVHQEEVKFELCHAKENNSKKQGAFSTPGYSYPQYETNKTCMMIITRYSTEICKIKLSVHSFDMAPRNNVTGECTDYIDWSRDGKKCGQITEKNFGSVEIPFTQGQQKIFIKFYSDSIKDGNGRGVQFVYEQSSQNC